MSVWNRILQLGFFGTILCICRRIYYYLLSKRYGFDIWHASAPFECRPYKAEVVKLADSVSVSSALEIGCGLGDIISRINVVKRVGVDIDPAVVFTAQKLNGRYCKFAVGELSDVQNLKQQCEGAVELLVMINWPHLLPWHQLFEHIQSIIDQIGVRYVLIDGINDSIHGYANYHRAECFGEIGEIVHAIPSSDGARVLYLIRACKPKQVSLMPN